MTNDTRFHMDIIIILFSHYLKISGSLSMTVSHRGLDIWGYRLELRLLCIYTLAIDLLINLLMML